MKKKLVVLGLSMAGVLMLSNTAFAGEWKRNNVGWWYQESTGTYPTRRWSNIGGKWYYFDNVGYMVHDKWIGDYYLGSDGAMLIGTVTPDGYRVDASGKWISGSPEETIFENFIQNEEYEMYTSEWYVNPTKYGYLDIDGDGKEELIITSDDGFFYALICSADLQSGEVTILDNGYYYGSLRYSEKYHALVLTEFRTSSMLGDYAFMEINGSGLDSKFHLGWDATEGERFYYRGKSKISEEEFDTYFSDLKEPDYMWLN